MSGIEQLDAIYRHLPLRAQQEALDFLLFLDQRYGNAQNAQAPSRPDAKCVNAGEQPTAAAILRDSGFIGSLDAEPEYSENYKQELTSALGAKHGYR